jgi:flagellin-specific chaperone FliS
MNPLAAYQQHTVVGWARIDMLLALYDQTIQRLEEASAALGRNDGPAAKQLLANSRLLVGGLLAGLAFDANSTAENLTRLYEFVLHAIDVGTVEMVQSALRVLRTLRQGFEGIRPEANLLERGGLIPSADAAGAVQQLA